MPKRCDREQHVTRTKTGCGEETELCKIRKDDQRTAANRRERLRMRVLSKAFGELKTFLPWVPVDTKLSKLDTLRLASSYIGHLNQLLTSEDSSHVKFCPENLSWPLLFDSRTMDGAIRNGRSSPESAESQSA